MKILKFILGPMGTNCYFITDGQSGTAAVVDPAAEADTILANLERRSLRCAAIILTHAHFDHMMALNDLRGATGAPLYMHPHDTDALADPAISYARQFGGSDYRCAPPEHTVDEGDRIPLGGDTLGILHTPGHTMGSICIEAGENLLTGDTLFREGIGRYDLYGGDYEQLMASVRRLRALDFNYRVFPGHGASSHLDYEKNNNFYMQ